MIFTLPWNFRNYQYPLWSMHYGSNRLSKVKRKNDNFSSFVFLKKSLTTIEWCQNSNICCGVAFLTIEQRFHTNGHLCLSKIYLCTLYTLLYIVDDVLKCLSINSQKRQNETLKLIWGRTFQQTKQTKQTQQTTWSNMTSIYMTLEFFKLKLQQS